MLLINKRLIIMMCICFLFGITGCGAKEEVISTTEQNIEVTTKYSDSEVDTEINQESVTDSFSDEKDEGDNWNEKLQPYLLKEGSGIYQISDLVMSDSYEFITYAVMPKNKLMILSLDNAKREVVVEELNLSTLEKQETLRTQYLKPKDGKIKKDQIEIVCPDPIIIYDRSTNHKYYIQKEFPSGNEIFCYEPVIEMTKKEDVFSERGQFCAVQGNYIELVREKENGLLLLLPEKYLMKKTNEIVNGCPLFRVEDIFEGKQETETFLELKPGGLTYEAFYYNEVVDLDVRIEQWGVKVNTDDKKILLYNYDEETLRSYDQGLIENASGNQILFSRWPIYDSRFIFTSGEDKVFLVDGSISDSEGWTPPERNYVELGITEFDVGRDIAEYSQELMEKYDVDIYYGENVKSEISDFSYELLENDLQIRRALFKLDLYLSAYPEGFFKELDQRYGYKVELNLVGKTQSKQCEEFIAGGVTVGNKVFLAMVYGFDFHFSTLFHELIHVMDNVMRENGIYSQAEWNEMNPEGFSYLNAYFNDEGVTYDKLINNIGVCPEYLCTDKFWNECYFADKYAKSKPEEDRAETMKRIVMSEDEEPCIMKSHLYDKGVFFSNLIRKTFDDSSWKNPPLWERKLGIDLSEAE